jgi:hypothetical protein
MLSQNLPWRTKVNYKQSENKIGSPRIKRLWGAFVKPLLQWKSIKNYIFWLCICSLRYTACNAHAPYCHPWTAQLYNIFPPYFITGTIFEKDVIEQIMCILIFCASFIWNISHSKKKCARYNKKNCMLAFTWSTRLARPIFNETGIITADFLNIFEYHVL